MLGNLNFITTLLTFLNAGTRTTRICRKGTRTTRRSSANWRDSRPAAAEGKSRTLPLPRGSEADKGTILIYDV